MKNMLIAQSGGPSPAINASLAGAVQTAMASGQIAHVYGALHGLEGLLGRRLIDIGAQMRTAFDFELLTYTPAMALGSCRFKLPHDSDEVFSQVLHIFEAYDIGYFFYCGGNDSMDTACRLSAYFRSQGADIKCIGIPKTVDNDLVGTDHTPGFGSAARFIAASFSEIMIDSVAYPARSVTVMEVMGRNAGWLTASSVLARAHGFTGPHMILLPEVPFDPDAFLRRTEDLLAQEEHVLVAVSEGVKYKDGSYVAHNEKGGVDMFGHHTLGGAAEVLEEMVHQNMGCKTRSVEPSVLQRVGIHLASGTDLREAQQAGRVAVESALAGLSDVMVGIERVSDNPYLVRFTPVPLNEVANHERCVPLSWICDDGFNVTAEMERYLRPLFRGETQVHYEDGLPRFFRFDTSVLAAPPAAAR